MRTTITLDHDVAAAVEQMRHERQVGLSEAVNELVRRGLQRREPRPPITLETARLDLRFDVANVAEALEIAEGGGG